MNKEFVPYEEAIALKELGFDELCLAYYQKSSVIGDDTILPLMIWKEPSNWNDNSFSKLGVPFYSAPLYQQAFRWFREEYGLGHMINGTDYESFIIELGAVLHIFNASDFKTYEEAELACLKTLIKILKDE